MATTNTVVLSASDFLTKLDYHNKRKSLVADGYKVTGSTKTNVTLVKEVAAPSRRNATPSRRRAPAPAPATPAPVPEPTPAPASTPARSGRGRAGRR